MRAPSALASLLVAAVCLGPACGGSDVTAARVVVLFQPGVVADQLRLEVVVAGVPLVAAAVPARPAGPLRSASDLVVRFPDSVANQPATFYVGTFAQSAQTGRGERTVTLAIDRTVIVEIAVDPAVCPAQQHQCAGACVADTDVTGCGLACLACAAPAAHGAAACTAGLCALACDAGYAACDDVCANLTIDPHHCGTCARACSATEVCNAGACVANPCPVGQHLCGSECVTDDDVAHCGRACEPCPTPPLGTATCDGTQCGASCPAGFHACGSQCVSDTAAATCGTRCVPCPAPASGQGQATCSAGSCGVTCNSGYHACGGDCVSNTDPAHCGTSCTPCVAPVNGTATCVSGTCDFTCTSGYSPCLDACIPAGQSCQATWARRSTGSGTAPSGRTRPGLAYDAGRQVTVLYGGWDGAQALDDTWEWNGSAWSKRTPTAVPGARSAVAMAYDATRGQVVLFGGETALRQVLDDTWLWDGTTWTIAPAYGPAGRSFAGLAWDRDYETLQLFGGWNGTAPLDDLWSWDGAAWYERGPDGGPPAARANFGMVYDAHHGGGQLVVVGGSTNTGGAGLFADTWVLANEAWDAPTLATAPSARAGQAFAYDTTRGLGVLFGGFGGTSIYLGDTWAWSTGWNPLATAGAPEARWRGAMVYDSARDVMVLFGGAAPPSTYYNDVWELSW